MQTLKDLNPLRRLNTPGPLHSPEKQFKLTWISKRQFKSKPQKPKLLGFKLYSVPLKPRRPNFGFSFPFTNTVDDSERQLLLTMIFDKFTLSPDIRCLGGASPHFTASSASESLPPLPQHLDRFIEQDWNPEHSAAIDKWLQYTELEFGCDGDGSHE
jgi:hypothetical protein